MDKYKIIKKKPAYKSEKIQIDAVTLGLPNGNQVEWDVIANPDFYYGIPIRNKSVLMTKEWRLGPEDFLTQFTTSRAKFETKEGNLSELKKELKEELGLTGGTFENLIKYAQGFRITGYSYVWTIEGFSLEGTQRDENEIQEIIELPIKGLYDELLSKHIVTADTLLIAKLLEEKYV